MNEIYPTDLVLTKENVGTSSATVLDLDINIVDNTFDISVYDKTNNFNFDVVKFPSLQSNIPDNVLYNVYYSQLIRYLNISSNSTNFLKLLKQLTDKCKLKGTNNRLNEQIKKLFKTRFSLLSNLKLLPEDIKIEG